MEMSKNFLEGIELENKDGECFVTKKIYFLTARDNPVMLFEVEEEAIKKGKEILESVKFEDKKFGGINISTCNVKIYIAPFSHGNWVLDESISI